MAGDGDRKALDANGRELVDALTSLLAGDVRGKVLLLLCFKEVSVLNLYALALLDRAPYCYLWMWNHSF